MTFVPSLQTIGVREPYRERACCPKCGHNIVSTRHITVFGRSALARVCQRCTYEWRQAPMDAKAL